MPASEEQPQKYQTQYEPAQNSAKIGLFTGGLHIEPSQFITPSQGPLSDLQKGILLGLPHQLRVTAGKTSDSGHFLPQDGLLLQSGDQEPGGVSDLHGESESVGLAHPHADQVVLQSQVQDQPVHHGRGKLPHRAPQWQHLQHFGS
jgi:hypothetical protein